MSGGPVHPDGKFKRIVEYTPTELDQAVENAVGYLRTKDIDFFRVLSGIDAYMERRRRKYSK